MVAAAREGGPPIGVAGLPGMYGFGVSSVLREPRNLVSSKALWLWVIGSLLGWVFVLVAMIVVNAIWGVIPWWGFLAVVIVAALEAGVVPVWRYRVHRWEVTDDALYSQSGAIWRKREIVPISRLQAIDYAAGPVERLLGLASVEAKTASYAGSVSVAGLDREVAINLVEHLTHRAQLERGDAT